MSRSTPAEANRSPEAGDGVEDMDTYEITIDCRPGERLLEWLDCERTQDLSSDEARILSRPLDQAGLHGLLARLRDLNIGIVSIRRVARTET